MNTISLNADKSLSNKFLLEQRNICIIEKNSAEFKVYIIRKNPEYFPYKVGQDIGTQIEPGEVHAIKNTFFPIGFNCLFHLKFNYSFPNTNNTNTDTI